MTAINISIAGGSTGYMLTDCAHFEPDGKLQYVANKAISLPHAQTVVAVRGSVIFQHILLVDLHSLEDFDKIVGRAGECGRKRWESLTDDLRGEGAEFVVMGSSEEKGCVAAAICRQSEGFEPAFSNGITAPGAQINQSGCSVESYLLRLMEEQRRIYRKGEGSAIGGAAILTTVDRYEIKQRVVHRWDDKVGERISP
jgi:hypothetical protein